MKKIFLTILLCLITSTCFGLLASTTVWEVRTTGAATNGGGYNPNPTYGPIATLTLNAPGTGYTVSDTLTITGSYFNDATITVDSVDGGDGHIDTWHLENAGKGYAVRTDYSVTGGTGNDDATFNVTSIVPGTDYSQQNAAQLTLTDGTTSGIGNAELTSATGGFTEAMIGNILYISSGTNATVGYYQIDDIQSSNIANLDRAPDDGVGAVSGANFKVGGAVDHPYRVGTDFITDSTTKIWVKKGTYTYIAGLAVLDATYMSEVEGYNATRGDDPAMADQPQFDGDSYGNTGHGIYITTGSVYNCTSYGNAGYGIYIALTGSVYNCTSYGNTLDGIITLTGSAYNCTSYGNTLDGIRTDSAYNCTSYGNTLDGIQTYIAYNCTSYGNTRDGIRTDIAYNCTSYGNTMAGIVSYPSLTAVNCIAYNNGAQGFMAQTLTVINCIAYNNGAEGFYSDWEDTLYAVNCISLNNATTGFFALIVGYFDYNCYYGNTPNLNGIVAGAHDVNADPLFTDVELHIDTITLNAAGTGYTAADELTLIAGASDAKITVDSVDGGDGHIDTWHLENAGTRYGIATGVTVTGGTGNDDATFDITAVSPVDFTLQATSPCLAAGTPGAMPGLTGAYKYNIGVDQDDNTAGGTQNDIFGWVN
jgi:hypothetical protein